MRDDHTARQPSQFSRPAQEQVVTSARLEQSALLPRMSMHTALVGLSFWNEEIFMQTSYLAAHPTAQQTAGDGQQFAQEEAMDAMEEMLD